MPSSTFIVLTTYNGVKYIAQQLNSLLAQSWPCQIYIFDDGSTDGTVELIQTHYLKHPNLHLSLNKKKLGYVRNFEQGIRYVYRLGAQYIALCDQDDIWHPERIEKMITLAEDKNTIPTLIYSDLQMMDANEQILHSSYLQYRGYTNRAQNSSHSLAVALGQNGVMGNTTLINRALACKILPFPENLHSHDYWLSLIAQLCGECIFISEPLVSYRIHSSNSSNSTQTLNNSSPKHLGQLWRKIQKKDYQLPFKEDSRAQVITLLLGQIGNSGNNSNTPKNKDFTMSSNTFHTVSQQDRALISGFLHYLNLDKPRWYLAYWMLKHKFIKKGLEYRLRFIYRILTTKRYS